MVKEDAGDSAGSAVGSLGGSAVGSEEGTPAPSEAYRDPAQLLKHNTSVHDMEGEGEESEETEHEVRSKVYKMGKKEDGWTDLGIGESKHL